MFLDARRNELSEKERSLNDSIVLFQIVFLVRFELAYIVGY